MRKESETPPGTVETGSCGSDPVARRRVTWLELLSEPREWQSILRSLSAGRAALAGLPRQLAEAAEAIRRQLESPQLRQLVEELSRPGWWDRAANAYCDSYQLEIVELGVRPLSEEEQSAFMVFGSMLAKPGELGLGRRPPLLQVAVAGQRPDIALAVLLRQGLDRRTLRSLDVADRETREELAGQATLALGEEILPGFERRVNSLGFGGLVQLRPLLVEVTKDAYLVVAIHRELIRYLKKEALQRKREDPTEPDALEDELPSEARQEHLLDYWVLEQSIARCLDRPRAKPVDAQILKAIADDPGRSSASIAKELKLPATTVRYRRHLIMEFLREDLEE